MKNRVIHSRKKVKEIDDIFTNKFSLTTWILSILKWKEFGDSVVFYCDNGTYEKLKEFEIDKLYDEVNVEILESCDICGEIHFEYYWAMSKFLAYENEIKNLGNNPIIADTDVVPMRDLSGMLNLADILIWSNKEYLVHTTVYPKLSELSLPEGYEIPFWFTGDEKPLNTGILYFRNKDNALDYIDHVEAWVKGNKNEKNNNLSMTMCNAEQRMLGELAHHRNWGYFTVQPINKGIFNSYAFHTHGYKDYWERGLSKFKSEVAQQWILNFLLMIRKLNPSYFNKLLSFDLFKEEKEYFNKNGYTAEVIEELKQYSDLF